MRAITLPHSPAPPTKWPFGTPIPLETAAEVESVLEALAPHFRSVLTLREIEGLSCPEIADIVGATHVTVRWRLHRGRKLFQEEWERRARLRQQRGGTAMLGSPLHSDGAAGSGGGDQTS